MSGYIRDFAAPLIGTLLAVLLLSWGYDFWERLGGPPVIRVVDGDTLRVNGELVRLQGFNAPEVHEAQCEKERKLGLRATGALKEMVSSKDFKLRWLGEKGGYGRPLAIGLFRGRDVGKILISRGLAHPYPDRHKKDWCK